MPSLRQLANFVLSVPISLHGSEPIPMGGFRIALRHSHSLFVSQAEIVLILGSSSLGVCEKMFRLNCLISESIGWHWLSIHACNGEHGQGRHQKEERNARDHILTL